MGYQVFVLCSIKIIITCWMFKIHEYDWSINNDITTPYHDDIVFDNCNYFVGGIHKLMLCAHIAFFINHWLTSSHP